MWSEVFETLRKRPSAYLFLRNARDLFQIATPVRVCVCQCGGFRKNVARSEYSLILFILFVRIFHRPLDSSHAISVNFERIKIFR